VDLSALTDTFHWLRDTGGTALQVVASADGQPNERAAHQLGALLRLLDSGRETLLFRMEGPTAEMCQCCQWPTSKVFALHAASDLSSCWLLPHLAAEQSVLCGELEDERQMYELAGGAQTAEVAHSVRLALMRLPLAAGPFNPELYSSGWAECAASVLDRATLVTNTAHRESKPVSLGAADDHEAMASESGQEEEGAAEAVSDDSASSAAAANNDAEVDRATEGQGRARTQSKRRSRRRLNRSQSAADESDTSAASEHSARRTAVTASRKVNRRSGSGSGGGRTKGQASRARRRGRGRETGGADTDDEWCLSTSNSQLDAEVASLIQRSGERPGSLRLLRKKEAQQRVQQEAERNIALIEQIAAERFRQKLAAQQQRQQQQQQQQEQESSSAAAEKEVVRSVRLVDKRRGRRVLLDSDEEEESTEAAHEAMEDESNSAAVSALRAIPTSHATESTTQPHQQTGNDSESSQSMPPLERPDTLSAEQQPAQPAQPQPATEAAPASPQLELELELEWSPAEAEAEEDVDMAH